MQSANKVLILSEAESSSSARATTSRQERYETIDLKKELCDFAEKRPEDKVVLQRFLASVLHTGTNKEKIIRLSVRLEKAIGSHLGRLPLACAFTELYKDYVATWKTWEKDGGSGERHFAVAKALFSFFAGSSLFSEQGIKLEFCTKEIVVQPHAGTGLFAFPPWHQTDKHAMCAFYDNETNQPRIRMLPIMTENQLSYNELTDLLDHTLGSLLTSFISWLTAISEQHPNNLFLRCLRAVSLNYFAICPVHRSQKILGELNTEIEEMVRMDSILEISPGEWKQLFFSEGGRFSDAFIKLSTNAPPLENVEWDKIACSSIHYFRNKGSKEIVLEAQMLYGENVETGGFLSWDNQDNLSMRDVTEGIKFNWSSLECQFVFLVSSALGTWKENESSFLPLENLLASEKSIMETMQLGLEGIHMTSHETPQQQDQVNAEKERLQEKFKMISPVTRNLVVTLLKEKHQQHTSAQNQQQQQLQQYALLREATSSEASFPCIKSKKSKTVRELIEERDGKEIKTKRQRVKTSIRSQRLKKCQGQLKRNSPGKDCLATAMKMANVPEEEEKEEEEEEVEENNEAEAENHVKTRSQKLKKYPGKDLLATVVKMANIPQDGRGEEDYEAEDITVQTNEAENQKQQHTSATEDAAEDIRIDPNEAGSYFHPVDVDIPLPTGTQSGLENQEEYADTHPLLPHTGNSFAQIKTPVKVHVLDEFNTPQSNWTTPLSRQADVMGSILGDFSPDCFNDLPYIDTPENDIKSAKRKLFLDDNQQCNESTQTDDDDDDDDDNADNEDSNAKKRESSVHFETPKKRCRDDVSDISELSHRCKRTMRLDSNELERTSSSLLQSSEDVANWQAEHGSFQQKINELNLQILTLQNALLSNEKEKEKLTEDLSKSNEALSEKEEEGKTRKEHLEEALEKLRKENNELKECRNTAILEKQGDLLEKTAKIQEYEQILENLRQKQVNLETETNREHFEALSTKEEEVKATKAQLEEALESLKMENEKMTECLNAERQREFTEASNKIQEYENTLETMKQENSSLKTFYHTETERNNQQLQFLQEKCTSAEIENKELLLKMTLMEKTQDVKLEELHKRMSSTFSHLSEDSESKLQRLQEMKSRNAYLVNKQNEDAQVIHSLKGDLIDSTGKHDGQLQENKQLTDRLRELEKMLLEKQTNADENMTRVNETKAELEKQLESMQSMYRKVLEREKKDRRDDESLVAKLKRKQQETSLELDKTKVHMTEAKKVSTALRQELDDKVLEVSGLRKELDRLNKNIHLKQEQQERPEQQDGKQLEEMQHIITEIEKELENEKEQNKRLHQKLLDKDKNIELHLDDWMQAFQEKYGALVSADCDELTQHTKARDEEAKAKQLHAMLRRHFLCIIEKSGKLPDQALEDYCDRIQKDLQHVLDTLSVQSRDESAMKNIQEELCRSEHLCSAMKGEISMLKRKCAESSRLLDEMGQTVVESNEERKTLRTLVMDLESQVENLNIQVRKSINSSKAQSEASRIEIVEAEIKIKSLNGNILELEAYVSTLEEANHTKNQSLMTMRKENRMLKDETTHLQKKIHVLQESSKRFHLSDEEQEDEDSTNRKGKQALNIFY